VVSDAALRRDTLLGLTTAKQLPAVDALSRAKRDQVLFFEAALHGQDMVALRATKYLNQRSIVSSRKRANAKHRAGAVWAMRRLVFALVFVGQDVLHTQRTQNWRAWVAVVAGDEMIAVRVSQRRGAQFC
jgi:hypothetical protein